MNNGEHQSLAQIQAFMEGNEGVEFKAPARKEVYEWTQSTLCAQSYMSLHRSGKGLVKRNSSGSGRFGEQRRRRFGASVPSLLSKTSTT